MKVSEFIIISCSLRVSNRYEMLNKMGTIKKMKPILGLGLIKDVSITIET